MTARFSQTLTVRRVLLDNVRAAYRVGETNVEHRFEEHAPRGWLAGAWWNGDTRFCKWEYDLANRLLFVDLADQVCIESLDDSEFSGDLHSDLPDIALRFATRGSREHSKDATIDAKRTVDEKVVPLTRRTYTTINTTDRRRI